MSSLRGKHMQITSHIPPKRKDIPNAYMNELSDISRGDENV